MEILDVENMTPNQNHSQLKSIPSPLKRSSAKTRLSPLKDKKNFFESSLLSPTRSSPLKESNNVDGITVPIIEYKKLERSLADSIIKNKDLIREQEKLEDDLLEKNKQIECKSRKINELVQENSSIMTELRNERELNEQEFNSWSDLKSQLEFKIYNLNQFLKNHEENANNSTSSLELIKEDQLYTDIQNFKTEINKLKKKLIVLQKENELEVQSKMMIIEELEILKEKWDELGTKHELLKQDYEELVQEFTSLKIDETEDGDDEVTTPTADELIMSPDVSIGGKDEFFSSAIDSPSLRIKKKRVISSTSSATTSSSNDKNRKSSYRNSSLTKIIRDIELKSQKQKHSQEMMKYNFEIKSLQLQNEKLHSYIGFLLQQMEDFDKTSNSRITSYSSVNSTSTATENQMNTSDINNNNNNANSNVRLNSKNDDNDDDDKIINHNSIQSCNTKIPTTTISPINQFEYSDEINIRSAKKNLKTIMKSASAFPIRPSNFEKELKYLDPNFLKTCDVRKRSSRQKLKNSISNSEINNNHRSKKINSNNYHNTHNIMNNNTNSINTNSNNINNKEGEISDEISFNGSVCNSIDYSTDYNQGEVEYLDLGDSDFSFEEDVEGDGDVEDGGLEEDNDEPVVGVRRTLDHNSRTSTDSLNVSFKMDLVPQLNLKRSKLFKRAPRKQLQKLTTFPSQMNIKIDNNFNSEMGNDSEFLLNMKSSNKNLNNHSSSLQLNEINNLDNTNNTTNTSNGIFSYPEIIDQKFAIDELEDESKKLYFNNCFDYEDYDNSEIRLNNDKYKKFSIFNHISEEEEEDDDDYRIGMSTSEDDDDDDDDDDDFNISTQEIDMFKIVVLRKFYCPRHSMFQCFCRSMDLVDPGSLYLAFSPVIGLKRRLRLQKQRERERGKHSHSRNHPMRYHKHEKEILPHVLENIKRAVIEEENETEQTSSCNCKSSSDTNSNHGINSSICPTANVEGDRKLVDENDIYIVD